MSKIIRVAEFTGADPNGRGQYRDVATQAPPDRIRLRLFRDDGEYFDITPYLEGSIEILGSDSLTVLPVVANCIHIDLEKRP